MAALNVASFSRVQLMRASGGYNCSAKEIAPHLIAVPSGHRTDASSPRLAASSQRCSRPPCGPALPWAPAGTGVGGFRGDAERWPGGGCEGYMRRVVQVWPPARHGGPPPYAASVTAAAPRSAHGPAPPPAGSRLTAWPSSRLASPQELMPLVQHEFNTATDPAKVAFGGGSFAGGRRGQGCGGCRQGIR